MPDKITIEDFAQLVQDFVDCTWVPEPDCSCFVNPPCPDCLDNHQMRELLAAARYALSTYRSSSGADE